MFLEIITPDKKLFEGDIKSVTLPGSNGSFQILDNHAPIVSSLDANGVIKVADMEGKELFFNIKSGVVEVYKNNVIVLTEERLG